MGEISDVCLESSNVGRNNGQVILGFTIGGHYSRILVSSKDGWQGFFDPVVVVVVGDGGTGVDDLEVLSNHWLRRFQRCRVNMREPSTCLVTEPEVRYSVPDQP